MKKLLVLLCVALAVPSLAVAQSGSTLWPGTKVPTVADAGPDSSVELGVKFRSDSAGYITGIRFYKATANTGTHTGSLWTGSGTLLATATFSGETASGWQQVTFASPVSIAAGTVYVASYHAGNGHYSDDEDFFATTGTDTAPLHALADGVSGVNGVYAYGSSATFPNLGWRSSNYWVDVVFTATTTPDTLAPTVTAFAVPTSASALTVAVTSFTASDDIGVTGYIINESSVVPAASATGWSAAAPTSYTFATAGTKTLYAWAKDAVGNVSVSKSASVTITLVVDTTKPTVTAFTLPTTASSLTVAISSFTATDNIVVTGYMATTSATAPTASASGWASTPPTSYTFTSAGTKALYGWAKDAAGNVSTSKSASVTITLGADLTKPTITAFTMPTSSTSLTVAITKFTATDNVAVTGYRVSTSSTTPTATSSGWTTSAPVSYTFSGTGSRTLYAWAKDAARNVSARSSATVSITTAPSGPEPAGWYAGDMHVHRSCGGSPEAVSSLYSKMSTNNLSFISLLADMGNGEVQNATTDLPKVTGGNDSVSTSSRVVHWDAEWHWDATYGQYGHQALGGHIVALGLASAQQIWQEYTYPILNWAHQQGGIAGFVHMQYLDDGFPTYLTCCTPIEYPVEVALGAADFISEDVTGSETAIAAYYRLLNTGFRPALTAGSDYPCGTSTLGNLLTYAQVAGGQMSYDGWIDGIAARRTVISRNGHNEFVRLTLNGSAGPGDEIALVGGGNLPVTIQWTSTQSLSGDIELVLNGQVVAAWSANVAKGSPAEVNTTVAFTRSGWLAARRMDGAGHVVHTGAVFVTVDGAPVRESSADALFYVDWMNQLLARTASGGEWNWYFPTSLTQARARYSAARTLFQQIAKEAAAAGR
jgi:hypothetical protein